MKKAIALAVLISIAASGCGSLNEDLYPTRYHVICYQYGVVIFDDILIQKRTGVVFYWVDEETGLEVVIPDEGCVLEEIPNES
jgi:hypothetical protein